MDKLDDKKAWEMLKSCREIILGLGLGYKVIYGLLNWYGASPNNLADLYVRMETEDEYHRCESVDDMFSMVFDSSKNKIRLTWLNYRYPWEGYFYATEDENGKLIYQNHSMEIILNNLKNEWEAKHKLPFVYWETKKVKDYGNKSLYAFRFVINCLWDYNRGDVFANFNDEVKTVFESLNPAEFVKLKEAFKRVYEISGWLMIAGSDMPKWERIRFLE